MVLEVTIIHNKGYRAKKDTMLVAKEENSV